MKVRFGANTYEISDTCELSARAKRGWEHALDEHGPEGILASLKYREAASCMLDDLKTLGVEVVDPTDAEGPEITEAIDDGVEAHGRETSGEYDSAELNDSESAV